MESGNVVEYIDRQKIMCAVIMEVKSQRLRLLTENNREVKLSTSRLSHQSKVRLDPAMSRDSMVEALKEIANRRKSLLNHVDVKELWEVLNTEQEWIDLPTMTEFCFPENPTGDHESAVVRAFFENRIYFKYNHNRFFPNSEKQVEQLTAQIREAARRNRILEEGTKWLKTVSNGNRPDPSDRSSEYAEILKSFYLFEKESDHYALAKAMLEKAGVAPDAQLFQILVKLGVWDANENIELYRYEIPTDFPDAVISSANDLVAAPPDLTGETARRDLTMLPLMTIDGQSTLDFDDALSIEEKEDHYRLGIHIVDVGHFVRRGTEIDREALARGSSIYMPDRKIPMLPPCLAEGLCSLKAGELRPAISIMVQLSKSAALLDYEIVPSLVRISRQLTYYQVNMMADDDKDILILNQIAANFRHERLARGAVQITLPEINVWIDETGEPALTRVNRESPGRMLVAEIMIMANWLMARFLAQNGAPAIFRSQPEPKGRLYNADGGTMFQNWMQRKLLSRFVLGPEPEHHSGLGLDAYATATSPIRKYFDLITQRQIRAILGLEAPYTVDEIEQTIQLLEQPMSQVSRIQFRRNRYWVLKYLEKKIGEKEEAIVLNKRRNNYFVLITAYMIECPLPISRGIELKPEDLVQVTIQHVDARRDILTVFLG